VAYPSDSTEEVHIKVLFPVFNLAFHDARDRVQHPVVDDEPVDLPILLDCKIGRFLAKRKVKCVSCANADTLWILLLEVFESALAPRRNDDIVAFVHKKTSNGQANT